MGKHAIIVIKNKRNEYLQYFDERWNSWLFPNCKMKSKDDIDSVINELKENLELQKENYNLIYIDEKVHKKFSESAKCEKEYRHYFYKVEFKKPLEEDDKKEFEKQNKKYKWFSFDELTKDERIQQVNSDIVGYIKELEL